VPPLKEEGSLGPLLQKDRMTYLFLKGLSLPYYTLACSRGPLLYISLVLCLFSLQVFGRLNAELSVQHVELPTYCTEKFGIEATKYL